MFPILNIMNKAVLDLARGKIDRGPIARTKVTTQFSITKASNARNESQQ